jgi:RHH-type rel operon transcriptional repressor/antitoxin RelB
MSTAISLRLPDPLARKLNGIAKETERSRAFHVQKALEAYMEDYADLQVALARLRDHNDHVISGKAMRSALGL